MRKSNYYKSQSIVLAMALSWLTMTQKAAAEGMTPTMTSLKPNMMGIAADQGDATEMGQRMGKFMGSFMREMKNNPERNEPGEGWRGENRNREYMEPSRRGYWREDEEGQRGYRGEGREVIRQVPLYDPWGATSNPYLMEPELWGGNPYYGRPHHPYRNGWSEPGPYGWAADYNWERGRGYYGAGLAPWETYEPPHDPRSERRWHDPTYYDQPPDSPREFAPWREDPYGGGRGYGPHWGGRRGSWW
ncbi:MAG: hypothetical protein G8237_05795 [Magnetococcales bacterium]|nr:hypothetical protein [Magnetococcales bacterium]NGZ05853.1 hypothetical protein [Magnetococcales bacterium]